MTGTGTIKDNDDPPTFSIDSPSVTEGDDGSVTLTYTVRRAGVSGRQISVDYADAGTGTATSGTDYEAITGSTFTFDPWTQNASATFDVSVTGDTVDEPHETILVALSNPTNATVSTTAGTGTGTINDGDPPSLSIRLADGHRGRRRFDGHDEVHGESELGERRVGACESRGCEVGHGDEGNGLRRVDRHWRALSAGETTWTLSVTVNGDEVDEADETILARLSNPVNAIIAVADGTGTTHRRRPLADGVSINTRP